MAIIHDLIIEAAVEFEAATGKKPDNVYLGEVEIEALRRWDYENNYTGKMDIDNPICKTHGTAMVEYDMDYEPGRCLGRWCY